MNKTEDELCSWIFICQRDKDSLSERKDHFVRLDDRSSSSA